MDWNKVGDKAYRRRMVLVVSETDKDALTHDPAGKEMLRDQNLVIVNIGDSQFFNRFRILDTSQPASGTLLVQSPYDENTYVDCTDARSKITLERLSYVAEFFVALGAKSIEILQIRAVEKETNCTASCDVESGLVSGDLKAKYAELSLLRDQVKLSYKANGSKPNTKKAQEILDRKRLNSDPSLSSLVKIMSENNSNQLTEYTKELNLAEDLNKIFELAGNLNFPTVVVSPNVQNEVKEKVEFFLSVKVIFK